MKADGWSGGLGLIKLFEAAAERLQSGTGKLDAINVFPVSDGDTGTNMLTTIRSALAAAVTAAGTGGQTAEVTAAALARGALEGARGNSGIILSQLFRALASVLEGRATWRPLDLREAFGLAATLARQGLSRPVEGTILTTMTDVARALGPAHDDLAGLLGEAVVAARASVAGTPLLLPVLKESGVVDAGALGLSMMLEGAWDAVTGVTRLEATRPETGGLDTARARRPPRPVGSAGYCAQIMVEGAAVEAIAVRDRLDGEGESLMVVGDRGRIRIHIHCREPAAIVEYARSLGRLAQLHVQDLDDRTGPVLLPANLDHAVAVVAVASGRGLRELFRGLGAVVVAPRAPEDPAELEDVVEALALVPSPRILFLPNHGQTPQGIEEAAARMGKQLAIVPAKTMPEGIAALVAFRFDEDFGTNARLMSDALGQVRTLAMPAGDPAAVAARLADLVGGSAATSASGVATVYYGAAVTPARAAEVCEALRRQAPRFEVDAIFGGQAAPDLVISVE